MKEKILSKYLFILISLALVVSFIYAWSGPSANPPYEEEEKDYFHQETLSSDKTLTSGVDKPYQYLATGGENRTITLSKTNASPGDRFVIKNIDAIDSSYYLEVVQDGEVLDRISAQAVREYIFDGTNWVSVKASGGDRVALGNRSHAGSEGVTIGENTGAGWNPIAIGINAYSCFLPAIGHYSNGCTGSALGNYANANNSGVAIGNYADGSDFGVAVGFYSEGFNEGIGLGAYAKGYQQGVGVGAYAKGMRYGVSVGYKAGFNLDENEDRYNVLIGAYAGYRLTTGKGNIIIGYQSGYDPIYSPQTGSKNILIGYKAGTPSLNTSNFLNLGNLIFAKGINTATGIGISSGQVGIGTYDPSSALEIVNPESSQPILTLKDDQENLVLKVLNEGKVGIKVSNPKAEFEVDGMIRVLPRSGAVCNSQYEGAIYYDADDQHLYGCNGTSWVQLDNS